MTDQLNADEIKELLARFRDQQFAVLVATAITLAAETCPDVLQRALAQVFDLTTTTQRAEEACRLAQSAFNSASLITAQIRELMEEINVGLDRLEKRIDQIAHNIEEKEKRQQW